MSMEMDDSIKRQAANRKTALAIGIVAADGDACRLKAPDILRIHYICQIRDGRT